MAKKPAPKKAPAKKPVAKKPAPKKKAAPAKKPAAKTVQKKVTVKPSKVAKPVKPAPAPAAVRKPEPEPVMKPVFETPAPKPAPVATVMPAVKMIAPKPGSGGANSLTIAAQSSAGAAASGNTHPANILVLVSSNGWPVTELTKDHFTIMEYFEVPGQQAPFSNNITSFRNAGTGAYLIQVRPINNAPWRSGHHLAQILVSSADDRQGQGAVKIIIR